MDYLKKEISSDECDFEEEKIDLNLNFVNFPNVKSMQIIESKGVSSTSFNQINLIILILQQTKKVLHGKFGHYTVMEKIAKGGSGVIFRANVVEFNQIQFNA